jgi:hypothetical protein
VHELKEIEAIKQLKYKYFRCLDSKQWDEMATCFTDGATAAYDDGKYAYDGRDAIMEFLSGALGSRDVISQHHGHHPEIELTGKTTARGVWYLEDYVIFKQLDMRLRGAAFYHDRYVKVDGQWKLEHTGYVRTYEEVQNASESLAWKLTSDGNHLD